MAEMRALEPAYLARAAPEERSGFRGGRDRWVRERSPLVEGIHRSGDFLDVGCANGVLAADVVAWAAQRGHTIGPHGIDLGPALVEEARERHPDHAAGFVVADLWQWEPARTWDFVYALTHLAPPELSCAMFDRLLSWVAEPRRGAEAGGRDVGVVWPHRGRHRRRRSDRSPHPLRMGGRRRLTATVRPARGGHRWQTCIRMHRW